MRSLLLLGALAGLGLAWEADLSGWEIDSTCSSSKASVIKDAWTEAANMVAKGVTDLKVIQEKMPPTKSAAQTEWNRIARAAFSVFGTKIDKDGYDPSEKNMANILYVLNRMNDKMHSSEVWPLGGFSGKLKKPLIVCGDDNFIFKSNDDNDPFASSGTVGELRELEGKKGAWIYKKRYYPSNSEKSSDVCEIGQLAVVHAPEDLVVFCDYFFSENVFSENVNKTPEPFAYKDKLRLKAKIENFAMEGRGFTVLHELVHYYGTNAPGEKDSNGNRITHEVPDQQAVDANGQLLWYNFAPDYLSKLAEEKDDGGSDDGSGSDDDEPWTDGADDDDDDDEKEEDEDLESEGVDLGKPVVSDDDKGGTLTKMPTYGFANVINLANKDVKLATFTAESYAFFCLMAVFDSYDWTVDGRAKALT